MTNKPYGALYIGVTSDLPRRVFEHKQGMASSFTKRYNLKTLVYAEEHVTALEAIAREKSLKKWNRDWKKRLISESNPTWRDLSGEFL